MSKILFEIVASDVGVSKRLDEIRARVKELKKEIKGTKEGSDQYERLANEIAAATVEVNELTTAQRALNREFKAAQVPTDSLAGLRLQYSALTEQITKLSAAERQSDFGRALIGRAAALKTEINGIEESVGRFTGSVGNYRKALVSIGDLVAGGLITGGIEAAVRAVGSVIQTGVKGVREYEQSLSNLSALTGLAGDELEVFRQRAESLTTIDLGNGKIVSSAREIFEAFKLVGGAQPELLKSADALKQVTQDAIVLAAASGDNLPDSVKALTTVLGQFQEPASAARRIVNELAAGAKEGASEIPDTTAALQKFGTTAKNANVSTAESVALVQTLAEQQVKAEEAGTQLRNVLVKLSSADVLPPRAIEEFEKAGVSIQTLRDTTLPLETRLRELAKLQGDTSALARIFGVENLTAAQILTNSVDRYAEFTKSIQGTNEAYRQAAVNTDNINAELENLAKGGVNILTESFRILEPAIVFVAQVLAQTLGFVAQFIKLLTDLPKFIQDNIFAIGGLATGILILNGNLIITSANTLRLAAAQRLQVAATYIATTATNLLNAALRANPIGLVITALSLLAFGLQTAYNKSETFRASINGLGEVAKELFTIFSESIGSFIDGFKKVSEGDFSGAVDSFGDAFKKSNPLGIAFTQGERLGNAFARGYANTEKNVAETAEKTADVVVKANNEIIESTDDLTKQQEQAIKAAAERMDAQLERIKEAERNLRSLSREALQNDFDRQIAAAEEKRLDALEAVEKRRVELSEKIKLQGGRIFETDQKETDLIKKETVAINAAYKSQVETITKARADAFKAAESQLLNLLLSVEQLGIQNGERLAQLDSQIAGKGIADKIGELETTLQERQRALRESLINGEITQADFDARAEALEQEHNVNIAALQRERLDQIITATNQLSEIKKTAAKAQLDFDLQAINASLQADIEAIRERARLQGTDATPLIEAREAQAIEQRTAAQQTYQKTVLDSTQAAEAAQIDAANAVNDADEQVQADKLQRIKEESDARKRLNDEIFATARAVTSAIFDIQANGINAERDARLASLDLELERRLEAVQGNAVAEEAIKKELEAKKLAIERDAAQKRKRAAIIEATVNTAVAVTKALTGAVPPLSFILAGLAAVAGAAQVAVIASQKFARGGFTGSGVGYKDSTGRNVAGVVHENEYVATTSQIKRFPHIFGFLEYDRRRDFRPFATGGFTSSDFTPQIGLPGAGTSNGVTVTAEARFSDKQVFALSQVLAKEISTSVSAEVKTGIADGLNDSNRRLERQTTLDEQRQV